MLGKRGENRKDLDAGVKAFVARLHRYWQMGSKPGWAQVCGVRMRDFLAWGEGDGGVEPKAIGDDQATTISLPARLSTVKGCAPEPLSATRKKDTGNELFTAALIVTQVFFFILLRHLRECKAYQYAQSRGFTVS
ncbi:hypothetical protein RB25_14790 [Herbaspirillum rubrisubalbicans]|nr:hypothetical protein RB25_14790 [Herbaspirillum rubrisubalbicans]